MFPTASPAFDIIHLLVFPNLAGENMKFQLAFILGINEVNKSFHLLPMLCLCHSQSLCKGPLRFPLRPAPDHQLVPGSGSAGAPVTLSCPCPTEFTGSGKLMVSG